MAIKNFKTNYGLDTSSVSVGASVKPSLNLDFVNNKTIDSRFTFTRSSNGTYVGYHGYIEMASNNTPRFTYDPVTLQSRGLLTENSATSLFNAMVGRQGWTPTNSTLNDDQTLSPDGTFSAPKLVENVTTSNKEIARNFTTNLTAGTSYTISIFAKAGERNTFRIGLSTGSFGTSTNVYFNVAAGTVITYIGGFTAARIEPYANGWYRCTATFVPTVTGACAAYFTLCANDGSTNTGYSGDGISGMYFWGVHAEQGTHSSSFIYPVETFASRSSTATYQDNTDGLIKRSNVNLITYSNSFTTSPWTRGGNVTLIANNGIAPDGTNSAWSMRMIATSSTWLDVPFTATAGVTYTCSIYARSQSNVDNQFDIFVWASSAVGVPDPGSGITTVTATPTWNRYTVQFTPATTGTYKFAIDNDANTLAMDVMIWGAQVEEGNIATLYAVTTSATTAARRYRYSAYSKRDMVPLLEAASTNLFTKSEALTHSDWPYKIGITATSNAATSPDGTTSATAMTEDTSTGNHLIQRLYTFTANTPYTFSVYAKAPTNTRTKLYLLFGTAAFSSQQNALFDLSTGTVSGVAANNGSRATMQPIANGWWRCSLSSLATTTAEAAVWMAISNGSSVSYTGTSNTIHLWGAQMEANTFASSYIPTDTTTMTRAVDTWNGGAGQRSNDEMVASGNNLFSFYNQNEGTIVVDLHATVAADQQAVNLMGVSGFGPQNIRLRKNISFGAWLVNRVTSPNVTLDINGGAPLTSDENSILKIAAAIKAGDFALVANGQMIATSNNSPLNEMGYMFIGPYTGAGAPCSGSIRSVTYYPKRLPDDEIKALTEQQQ